MASSHTQTESLNFRPCRWAYLESPLFTQQPAAAAAQAAARAEAASSRQQGHQQGHQQSHRQSQQQSHQHHHLLGSGTHPAHSGPQPHPHPHHLPPHQLLLHHNNHNHNHNHAASSHSHAHTHAHGRQHHHLRLPSMDQMDYVMQDSFSSLSQSSHRSLPAAGLRTCPPIPTILNPPPAPSSPSAASRPSAFSAAAAWGSRDPLLYTSPQPLWIDQNQHQQPPQHQPAQPQHWSLPQPRHSATALSVFPPPQATQYPVHLPVPPPRFQGTLAFAGDLHASLADPTSADRAALWNTIRRRPTNDAASDRSLPSLLHPYRNMSAFGGMSALPPPIHPSSHPSEPAMSGPSSPPSSSIGSADTPSTPSTAPTTSTDSPTRPHESQHISGLPLALTTAQDLTRLREIMEAGRYAPRTQAPAQTEEETAAQRERMVVALDVADDESDVSDDHMEDMVLHQLGGMSGSSQIRISFEGGRHNNEERVRQQQLLRGAISTKRVVSKKVIANLMTVEIDTLPESERTCIICYNDFGTETPEGHIEKAIQLPNCKHVFGNHCIKKWFEESDSCPYCRSKLPSEPQNRVNMRAIHQILGMANAAAGAGAGARADSGRESLPIHIPNVTGAPRPGWTPTRRSPPEDLEVRSRRIRPRHGNLRGASTGTTAFLDVGIPNNNTQGDSGRLSATALFGSWGSPPVDSTHPLGIDPPPFGGPLSRSRFLHRLAATTGQGDGLDQIMTGEPARHSHISPSAGDDLPIIPGQSPLPVFGGSMFGSPTASRDTEPAPVSGDPIPSPPQTGASLTPLTPLRRVEDDDAVRGRERAVSLSPYTHGTIFVTAPTAEATHSDW